MNQGELEPDGPVVQMVIEGLARPDADRGVVLNGSPRSLPQASALDGALAERGGGVTDDLVLEVPTDVLVERLSGRRACIGCRGTFHIVLSSLPFDGSCSRLGNRLVQRPNESPGLDMRRIAVYHQRTAPVVERYRARGVLCLIDGSGLVEQTRSRALEQLWLWESPELDAQFAGRERVHIAAG